MLDSLKDKFYLTVNKKSLLVWREMVWFYTLLFLVWGAYRLFFRMPVWIEEAVFKAIVFGVPVFLMARKKKWTLESLGITSNNFFQSVYLGLGLGVILGFVGQLGNVIRHGTLVFSDFGMSSEQIGGFLVLSLVTAF